ncbi:MAG: flagellar hook-basal body complex protein [Planctomycetaceae bacterium]|jgi:flagellar hook protein FlgE|nr:flagellar hook-basal body complex protein [Planctomycetaceae bacterium]
MGLFDTMNVAHTGMSAAETSIAVIGNNLSNANTTAFKSQRADFETIYARYYSLGSSPQTSAYTAGSNPIQIGQGVLPAGTTTDFSQGAIKPGMTNTDMAINGNGFFIVNSPDGTRQYFTRDGVFKLNSTQELITQNGDYVMGYAVNDHYQIQTDKISKLTIAVGKMKIAEATQNVSVEGLLNAVGDASTQGTVLESIAMTDLSWSSPESQSASVAQAARPSVEMSQTSAAENAGGGNLDAGDYLYRFVYSRPGSGYDDQTDYSSLINATVASGGSSVTINNLPLEQLPPDATPAYTHIAIYRAVAPTNSAEEPIFYQVDEIPVAAANAVYTDTKSNAEIAENPTLDLSRLDGSYQYYVTFTDANGNESRPSAVSASMNVNSGKITLSDIPTVDPSDNPDGWTGRKIYRSVAGGDQDFYLIETIDHLDPNVTFTDGASDAELVEYEKMSFGGKGNVLANANTLLSDVGAYDNESGRFAPMFANGTLELTPNKSGNDLKTANMTITDATSMGDYLKFLNEAYGIRTNAAEEIPKDQGEVGRQINGGSAGATIKDGKIVILGNAGVQNELQISANDFKLIVNGKSQTLDFQFKETQQCVGDGISTDLLVYDSLGAPVNVHLTLTLESKSNTETVYRWYADSIDNQPANGSDNIAVGSGMMRFDSEGKLLDSGDTTITIQRTDVASRSPLSFSFNMDMSAVAALATTSQTLSMTEQDGAGAGVLYDYSVDANGVIIGTFTSGVTRPLGQVLLAAFVNNEGLLQTGENLFTVGPNSGSPQIGIPGQGILGKIAGNSIEMSNTDIGNELIEMITASSMYRANAKIVTTSNEMLAALLNMV